MSRLTAIRRSPRTVGVPFPGEPRRPRAPRVPPASRRELGAANAAIVRVIGLATGGAPPNVFTTLGRHRRLFRAWLRFAFRLMPRGTLPRREAELVILRVAALCGSDYEWHQHVVLGQNAGLTADEIARVGDVAVDPGWGERDRLLLEATDELVTSHALGDPTWTALRDRLGENGVIELCLLVGNYAMLAGALNALGVAPEAA